MLEHDILRLAEAQHGVFGLRQASRQITRSEARHREERGWIESCDYPSIYRLAVTPRTWEQRVVALVLATGPGSAASHLSAAALLGMPGFRRNAMEVTTPRRWRQRAANETVHSSRELPAHHLTVVEGIAVTRAPRLIVDLAGVLPLGRVARALDNCLAAGTVTVESVRAVTDELAKRGRSGIRVMRTLLDERGDGYVATASELERAFLRLCREARLGKPEKQVNVGDEESWIARVDFAYPKVKLLIELDGRRHHSALLDADADRRRVHRLLGAGWRVVRFTWADLKERPQEVIRTVRELLAAAG